MSLLPPYLSRRTLSVRLPSTLSANSDSHSPSAWTQTPSRSEYRTSSRHIQTLPGIPQVRSVQIPDPLPGAIQVNVVHASTSERGFKDVIEDLRSPKEHLKNPKKLTTHLFVEQPAYQTYQTYHVQSPYRRISRQVPKDPWLSWS